MPIEQQLSHAEQMARLRRGEPGRYEFHFIIGESYEAFESMIAEAKSLTAHFNGTWTEREATSVHPESFSIVIS